VVFFMLVARTTSQCPLCAHRDERYSGSQPAATPVACHGWLAAQRPDQSFDVLTPGFVVQFHSLPLGQRLQVIGQLGGLRQPGATDEDRDSADVSSQNRG
jgi:hypothetical protein